LTFASDRELAPPFISSIHLFYQPTILLHHTHPGTHQPCFHAHIILSSSTQPRPGAPATPQDTNPSPFCFCSRPSSASSALNAPRRTINQPLFPSFCFCSRPPGPFSYTRSTTIITINRPSFVLFIVLLSTIIIPSSAYTYDHHQPLFSSFCFCSRPPPSRTANSQSTQDHHPPTIIKPSDIRFASSFIIASVLDYHPRQRATNQQTQDHQPPPLLLSIPNSNMFLPDFFQVRFDISRPYLT
jgi:hypothetical protein